MRNLMNAEKERRLQELPKLREADKIDISEEHLILIRKIFDDQPMIGNSVNTVTFFMAVRKHPEIRKIATTLARDPEGTSRIPRETFQQVFDRMERDI